MKVTELRHIVENIKEEKELGLGEIAKALKIDRSYFSRILNSEEGKEISSSLLFKLTRKFPDQVGPVVDGQHRLQTMDTNDKKGTNPGYRVHLDNKMLLIDEPENWLNKTAKSDDIAAARTQELIDTLKEHNKILKDVIEKNLDGLQTNLRTSQLLLRSLQTSQSAQHDVMIGSLERLEKKKKGSLAADADKLEFELNLQLQGMDSKKDGGKVGNREA